MNTSIISAFRNTPGALSSITWAVVFFFLWAQIEPAMGAIKEDLESAHRGTGGAALQVSPGEALRASLRDRLVSIGKRANAAKKKSVPLDFNTERAELEGLRARIKADDQSTLQAFGADLSHIQQYHLSDAARRKLESARAQFAKESAYVNAQLAQIATADDKAIPALAQQLQAHLDGLLPRRTHKFDPRNLPFRIADGKVRKPKTTQKELNDILNPSPGSTPTALSLQERRDTIDSGEWARVQDASRYGEHYRHDASNVKVASAGSLAGLVATAASLPPSAADLAATEDVQITPAIQALASQLNNNPVTISNWVHDNIEFQPTYGSIQGSDMTLQTKQGNSFDTSSLLIALLRASGIPARYAYGTIEVPADKVSNWLGGVNDPDAALQLLGQGGIPSIGLAQGGKIIAVRLEHVWVEAFVDFYPGRGARAGAGNGWVPIDASFKQYQDNAGLDLKSNVPVDTAALTTQIQQSATLDNAAGTVSAISTTNINNAITALQTLVGNYITQHDTTASLAGILGDRQIVAVPRPVLPASVPFHVVAVRSVSASLSANLRATATIQLAASSLDQEEDNSYFSYTLSLPQLASKRLTLSFDPASEGDTNALVSYLTAQRASIPAYQVNVAGTLRLDGTTVATSPAMTLGTSTWLSVSYSFPDGTSYSGGHDTVAGDYIAMVPKYSKIPGSLAAAIGQQARAVQTQLQSQNGAGLTKDQVTGLYLYSAGLDYWAQQELTSRTIARTMNIPRFNKAALGFFSWDAKVTYSYGIPFTATAGGMSTDIKINTSIEVDPDNQQARAVRWGVAAGMVSSFLEGSHWQVALNHLGTPTAGFSSAQILALAAQQGQTIYEINSQNVSAALAGSQIDPTIQGIVRDAVAQGFVVTIPAKSITNQGWTGTGMVILDPQTGSGDFKISGGLNGGGTSCQCFGFSPAQEFVIGMILTLVGLIPPLTIAVTIIAGIISLVDLVETFCELDHMKCLGGMGDSLKGLAAMMFGIGLVAGIAAALFAEVALIAFVGIYMLWVAFAVGEMITKIAELAADQNERNGTCTAE